MAQDPHRSDADEETGPLPFDAADALRRFLDGDTQTMPSVEVTRILSDPVAVSGESF